MNRGKAQPATAASGSESAEACCILLHALLLGMFRAVNIRTPHKVTWDSWA
jgi:hypothetical protein